MFINALFAFLHFVAAFVIFAAVFYEWLTFSKTLTHSEAVRLQKCDMWYGISAGLLLVVGLMRVFYFEKGSSFYVSNHVFWTKVALFVALGVLSIHPTVQFLSWRKDTQQGKAPVLSEKQFSSTRMVLRIEMLLLVGIVLCASMMAKGIGS